MRLLFAIFCVFYLRFVQINADELGRTPYCDKCKCVNNTLIKPDIDCSEASMDSEFYDPKYYSTIKDNKISLYPIGTLSLQENFIKEIAKIIPTSSLTKLDLSHNFIKTIKDEAFKNLTELFELDLSYNNLDKLNPNMFKGQFSEGTDYALKSLRILRLDGNKLHTIPNDAFEHIERQLEILSLSNNPFKLMDASSLIAISNIVYLKEVNLSYTEISDIPNGFFHTPKYLKIADLSGNEFTKIPKNLGDAHSLEVLYFDNNPITSIGPNSSVFPNIPTLRVLYLRGNRNLEHLGPNSLSGLGNLTELFISNNGLTKIDSDCLARMDYENKIWPPIKKLSLANNKLTEIDMEFYPNWEHLSYLDLRHNAWICACENQWMLDKLLPIYAKLNETEAKELKCSAPVEMEEQLLYNLSTAGREMRCLDMFGNRPERDGTMLITVLALMLIGIPLILFIMYSYQRNWFGLFDKSPAGFSRQFYLRTESDDVNI